MRKTPRRGLRLAEFQLFLRPLVCLLLPDVIADDLFGQTDRADAVAARPEVIAGEIALPPEMRIPDECGSPTTQLPGGMPKQHMHVIRQRVAFHQLDALPLT